MINGFENITQANGFDAANKNNAMQNNFACSLGEFGDYIYAGTARNELYEMFNSKVFGDLKAPSVLIPQDIDPLAEIWRYKKDNSESWELVYKSSPEASINKIMCMLTVSSRSHGSCLYAAAISKEKLVFIKTTDGIEWNTIPTGINENISGARIIIHERRYYMALSSKDMKPLLYVTDNPDKEWEKIELYGDRKLNPTGSITSLLSYNGHLYAGLALPGGFEVWRTKGRAPHRNDWRLVVDKGGGDEANEYPFSMVAFKNNIYVGTASFPFKSMNRNKSLALPKGFDLIKISRNDKWSVVIGGSHSASRKSNSAVKGTPSESGLSSGFDKLTNAFCSQLVVLDDRMYLGTFNWSAIIPHMISSLKNIFVPQSFMDTKNTSSESKWSILFNTMLTSVFSLLTSYGFDLWETPDGINWSPVTTTGFSTSENLGVAEIMISSEGTMYVGTANPFKGCEIWAKSKPQTHDTVSKKYWLSSRR